MKKLIIDSFELEVVDYLEEEKLIYVDLKAKSEEDMDRFFSVYHSHGYKDGAFKCSFGGKDFLGSFGAMVYDENYNIRLCLTFRNAENEYDDDFECFIPNNICGHNTIKELENLRSAVNKIADVLLSNGLIVKKNDILGNIPARSYEEVIIHKVEDIGNYPLKSTK